MEEHPIRRSRLSLLPLVLALLFAAGNLAALLAVAGPETRLAEMLASTEPVVFLRGMLLEISGLHPYALLYSVVSPAVLLVITSRMRFGAARAASQPVVVAAPSPTAPEPAAPALQLLRLLQDDARLIDFVQEDIDGYDDAQVGAAARSIHAGCRKAFDGRLELQRIFEVEEGSTVVVEKGFEAASVRLTGNLGSGPPFSGALQHAGWRATQLTLPSPPAGVDLRVLAPAEVEIS